MCDDHVVSTHVERPLAYLLMQRTMYAMKTTNWRRALSIQQCHDAKMCLLAFVAFAQGPSGLEGELIALCVHVPLVSWHIYLRALNCLKTSIAFLSGDLTPPKDTRSKTKICNFSPDSSPPLSLLPSWMLAPEVLPSSRFSF
jgi:hypothetical protein